MATITRLRAEGHARRKLLARFLKGWLAARDLQVLTAANVFGIFFFLSAERNEAMRVMKHVPDLTEVMLLLMPWNGTFSEIYDFLDNANVNPNPSKVMDENPEGRGVQSVT